MSFAKSFSRDSKRFVVINWCYDVHMTKNISYFQNETREALKTDGSEQDPVSFFRFFVKYNLHLQHRLNIVPYPFTI